MGISEDLVCLKHTCKLCLMSLELLQDFFSGEDLHELNFSVDVVGVKNEVFICFVCFECESLSALFGVRLSILLQHYRPAFLQSYTHTVTFHHRPQSELLTSLLQNLVRPLV